ncbi:MAG: YihY family inner membrane protein, partial [Gammaproteobacteria bacterium]|nr:YihY family inner membrane protein [Gammaproteobacteria bacterium]
MQKHKLWQFLKTLCIRFFEDQCPTRAASLAFTTLLSVVPLIIFIFYMLSFFPDLQQSGKEIEQFILNNFVASSANTIAHHLQIFTDNIHALSWINISALAFISILLIFNIIGSLNDIWHVSLKKDFGLSFFVNVIILFIAPIIFGFLLLFSAFLMSLPLLSRIVDVQFIAKPTMLIFP